MFIVVKNSSTQKRHYRFWQRTMPAKLFRVLLPKGQYFRLEVDTRNRKKLTKILENIAKTVHVKWIFCDDFLCLPDNLAKVDSRVYRTHLLCNAVLQIIDSAQRSGVFPRVVLIDLPGENLSMAEKLMRKTAQVTIITRKKHEYSKLNEKLSLENGTQFVLRNTFEDIVDADIVLSGHEICINFHSSKCLVFAPDTLGAWDVGSDCLVIPEECAGYIPRGIAVDVFLSALWEHKKARQLDVALPNGLCYGGEVRKLNDFQNKVNNNFLRGGQ